MVKSKIFNLLLKVFSVGASIRQGVQSTSGIDTKGSLPACGPESSCWFVSNEHVFYILRCKAILSLYTSSKILFDSSFHREPMWKSKNRCNVFQLCSDGENVQPHFELTVVTAQLIFGG